jgi:hypothetical protein
MLYIADDADTIGGTITLAQDPRKNRRPSWPAALPVARLLEPWQAAVKGPESAQLPAAERGSCTTRRPATRRGKGYSALPTTMTSTAVSPILA